MLKKNIKKSIFRVNYYTLPDFELYIEVFDCINHTYIRQTLKKKEIENNKKCKQRTHILLNFLMLNAFNNKLYRHIRTIN